MGKPAASSSIDIYLRLRPVARPSNFVEVDPEDQKIAFNIPRELAAG
jgi:hypothetical protein